ncbi:MAG: NitT/TauT family transport system substrate-binding protein [Verrucomicrobiaceae bacterium]|nr:NitT/TauT family transport system substrate-binding protein [Verrucomicrobiaceae bacterium]
MNRRHLLMLSASLVALAGCKPAATPGAKPVLRFGHFPNITHVQGLVAHALSRQGKGWYESRLGVEIQWYTYNAGPSATEAIFARSLDVTYVGPSPTLNAYAKSKGSEMRVLAGAANGGSSLVVRPAANINSPADFRGKKVATPQLGNTQDVQARAWLANQGFNITLTGGDVTVLPIQNADQLAMFTKGEIDAVWTAEPWVTRLELEANGKIFLEDKDTNVTLLVSSAKFVKDQPDLAKKLVAAHKELTAWIKANPKEVRELLKYELKAETNSEPKDALLDKALGRVVLTDEISRSSLDTMVQSAQKAGFLKDIPDLTQLIPSL